MGMLAKKLSTKIVDISWAYYSERNAPRREKASMIAKCGVEKFLFISENAEFYYIWNLVLLNDPPA